MRATAEHGVWIEDISPDIHLICDTNLNVIRVVNKLSTQSNASFNYDEEIKISDVMQIKTSIERTCKIGDFAPDIPDFIFTNEPQQ